LALGYFEKSLNPINNTGRVLKLCEPFMQAAERNDDQFAVVIS